MLNSPACSGARGPDDMLRHLLALGILRPAALRALREHPADLNSAAALALEEHSQDHGRSCQPRLGTSSVDVSTFRGAQVTYGPPSNPDLLERSNSSIYVPLIQDSVGMLNVDASAAWRTHPSSGSWWETACAVLQASEPVPVGVFLRSLWDAILKARSESPGCSGLAQSVSAYDRISTSMDVNSVAGIANLYQVAMDADRYAASLFQETCLLTFGGKPFAQQIALNVVAFRQWLRSSSAESEIASAGLRSAACVTAEPSCCVVNLLPIDNAASTASGPSVVNTDIAVEESHAVTCANTSLQRSWLPSDLRSDTLPVSPILGPSERRPALSCNPSTGGPLCAQEPLPLISESHVPTAIFPATSYISPSLTASALSHGGGVCDDRAQSIGVAGGRNSQENASLRPFVPTATHSLPPQLPGVVGNSNRELPPIAAASSVPSTLDRIVAFWRARQICVDEAVQHIYVKHQQASCEDALSVSKAYLDLPVEWPVNPQDFDLTMEDLFEHELHLFSQWARDSQDQRDTIVDKYEQQILFVKMGPFFLVVFFSFIQYTGTPPEMLFGLVHALAGWTVHKDFHARLQPHLPRKTRPRAPTQIIGDSNIGKSPFFDNFMQPWIDLVSNPSFKHLFADGGNKGLHMAKATAAEFAQRVKDADGYPIWATPENLQCMDTAYAMGKTPEQSTAKPDLLQTLETQNGLAFGPTSIKNAKQQVYVQRTNLCWYHMGQARVIHDFWGQCFEAKGNIRGVGLETRPWFLFAGPEREDEDGSPLVSTEPSSQFLRSLLLVLACSVGHAQERTNFNDNPMQPSDSSQMRTLSSWRQFTSVVTKQEHIVHPAAKESLGKHGYTTGAFVINNQTLTGAFAILRESKADLEALLAGSEAVIQRLCNRPLGAGWFELRDDSMIGAAAHSQLLLSGVLTVFWEMTLDPADRAGPPLASTERQPRKRTDRSSSSDLQPSQSVIAPLSDDEKLLKKVFERCQHKEYVSVADVNRYKHSARGNQAEVARIFDLASTMGAGVREGEPSTNTGRGGTNQEALLRFRLNLNALPAGLRSRLTPFLNVGAGVHSFCASSTASFMDLGDEFFGFKNSCFALHAQAALDEKGIVPSQARRSISLQLQRLATGCPLELGFATGLPTVLLPLHKELIAHGLCYLLTYCHSITNFQKLDNVCCVYCIGDATNTPVVGNLLIGIAEQHCVLSKKQCHQGQVLSRCFQPLHAHFQEQHSVCRMPLYDQSQESFAVPVWVNDSWSDLLAPHQVFVGGKREKVSVVDSHRAPASSAPTLHRHETLDVTGFNPAPPSIEAPATLFTTQDPPSINVSSSGHDAPAIAAPNASSDSLGVDSCLPATAKVRSSQYRRKSLSLKKASCPDPDGPSPPTVSSEKVEEFFNFQSQWERLIAFGKVYAQEKGLSSGFRPSRRVKEFKDRPPSLQCLCSGFTNSKQHKTRCSMLLRGEFDPDSQIFKILAIGSHNIEPSPAKPALKAKRHYHPDYTSIPVLASIGRTEVQKSEDLAAWAKQIALSKDDNGGTDPFDLTRVPAGYPASISKNRVRIVLRCSSCPLASQTKDGEHVCDVTGFAVYDPNQKMNTLYVQGRHADKQSMKYGTATTADRRKFHFSRAKQISGKLRALNSSAMPPPSKPQAKGMVHHVKKMDKKRKRPTELEHSDESKEWSVDDIREALRDEGLTLPSRLGEAGLDRDELVMVDEVLVTHPPQANQGSQTVYGAVLTTQELAETHLRLTNQQYIKLATDATFREVMPGLCTQSTGLLSKQYGPTTLANAQRLDAWATHYSSLSWTLASSESSEVVGAGFRWVGSLRNKDGQPLRKYIRQVAADWGPGIEKARQEELPDSIRGADYRHTFQAMRNGLIERLTKDANGQPEHLDEILDSVQKTRTHATTLAEFHLYWTNYLEMMDKVWGQVVAASYMRSTFFFTLPHGKANKEYKLTGVPRQMKVLCAAWWGSYERLQPGSVSGSQALETEHAHDFRGAFVDEEGNALHHLNPRQYIRALKEVARYKGRQLRRCTQPLPDVPRGPDPCSRSSTTLANYGRSSAIQLYKVWQETGNTIVRDVQVKSNVRATVLPRSLLMRRPAPGDPTKLVWTATPMEKLVTSEEEARLVASMAVERDVGKLQALWKEGGILVQARRGQPKVFHQKQWRHFRYHRVAVLDTEAAQPFWRCGEKTYRVCPCEPFGLGGRCEHEQTVAGKEDDDSCLATFGQRRVGGRPAQSQPQCTVRGTSQKSACRKKNSLQTKFQTEANDVTTRANIVPQSLRSDSGAQLCARPSNPNTSLHLTAERSQQNADLWSLVSQVGAQGFWSAFVHHGMTRARIADCTIETICSVLGLPLALAQDLRKAALADPGDQNGQAQLASSSRTDLTQSITQSLLAMFTPKNVPWVVAKAGDLKLHMTAAYPAKVPVCEYQAKIVNNSIILLS